MKLPALTRRERYVLAGTGLFLIVLIAFLAVDHVVQKYRYMDESIAARKEDLKRVIRLRDEYRSVHRELESIRSKLDKKEAGFSLLSFLENLANEQNIRDNIASFKPDKKTLNETYRELSVDLVIDNITLPQLVEFIYKIENSGHLVKVKRFRVKARFDNPDLLNATFQVSTFEKV